MTHPSRPARPAIMRKFVSDLTPDEVASLPGVIADYAKEMNAYKISLEQHNAAEAKKVEDLRRQCETKFGMVGHPKAELLWSKAWEQGHSNGLQEVYNAYGDLVDLAR